VTRRHLATVRLSLLAATLVAGAARAQGDVEPEATPTSAPLRIIVGYELSGLRFDSDEKLETLIASVAPLGSPFVESGPADQVGSVLIGTLPRVKKALEAVGYGATLSTRPGRGGLVVVADVQAYDRLRYVFVEGNGNVRQDEIQRRVSIRAGHVVPPAGPARTTTTSINHRRASFSVSAATNSTRSASICSSPALASSLQAHRGQVEAPRWPPSRPVCEQ